MLSSRYVEDIFLDFCQLFHHGKIPVQPHDVSIIVNFENVIGDLKPLTQNQGNYLLKILQKYQNFSHLNGLDYSQDISLPHWKHPFRVLDLSKKIFVTQDNNGAIWVCLKFPFQLKKEFESEFMHDSKSFVWDNENKVRKNKLYNTNLISLYEFAQRHSFEIDDSFMIAMGQVEEIWQYQDDLTPFSCIENYSITLKNASEDALSYFKEKNISSFEDDILLAKSMGFSLRGTVKNTIEKIASSDNNQFWIKDYNQYFNLIKSIKGKVVIVLDRISDAHNWLKNFSSYAEKFSISTSEIKVCFRESNDGNSGLNDWIKKQGYGGKVEEGRILIFLQKPAKWLFKDIENVKIVTTTSLYPSPNPIARDFFNSHSCVIYLGDIKPSEKKDQRIVEL